MGGGEVGLSDVGGVLNRVVRGNSRILTSIDAVVDHTYLVGLVGGSSSDLTLVARGKLSEITVVVTLPINRMLVSHRTWYTILGHSYAYILK